MNTIRRKTVRQSRRKYSNSSHINKLLKSSIREAGFESRLSMSRNRLRRRKNISWINCDTLTVERSERGWSSSSRTKSIVQEMEASWAALLHALYQRWREANCSNLIQPRFHLLLNSQARSMSMTGMKSHSNSNRQIKRQQPQTNNKLHYNLNPQ